MILKGEWRGLRVYISTNDSKKAGNEEREEIFKKKKRATR